MKSCEMKSRATIWLVKEKQEIVRENGKIAAKIRQELLAAVSPGVTTLELDELAGELFRRYGVSSSFKGFQGYLHHIVTCVNEEVVHGVPGQRRLKEGDLLTVDLGVYRKGYHVDTARTVVVRKSSDNSISNSDAADLFESREAFLRVGRKALSAAIQQAVPGNRVGDISWAMQRVVEEAGYNVVRAFVGHGVGKNLHEPPQIPCYGRAGQGIRISRGQTLAVEVMYVQGDFRVKLLEDGWTTVTRDGKLAAMFEDTVIVDNPPLVVTA